MNAIVEKKDNTNTLAMFGEMDFGDGGLGAITNSDKIVPRISVINQLSPQLKKGDPKYIKGAEYGDIADISNGVIVAKGFNSDNPTSVEYLPIARQKEVIEWVPRTKGGGIASREPLTVMMDKYARDRGAKQNDLGHWITRDGNELVETWSFFLLDINTLRTVVISFKKSGIGAVRNWFDGRIHYKTPNGNPMPLFARSIFLSSVEGKKDQNTWANYVVTEGHDLGEMENAQELFAAAAEAFKEYQDGQLLGDDEQEVSDEPVPF